MSRLSEALATVDAAMEAASKIFREDCPPGKEVPFMWSDGIVRIGVVVEHTARRQFHVFVRCYGKSYEVSAQAIVKGEEAVEKNPPLG